MENQTYIFKGITKFSYNEIKNIAKDFKNVTFNFKSKGVHKSGGLKYNTRINACLYLQGHIQDIWKFKDHIKHIIKNQIFCFEFEVK